MRQLVGNAQHMSSDEISGVLVDWGLIERARWGDIDFAVQQYERAVLVRALWMLRWLMVLVSESE